MATKKSIRLRILKHFTAIEAALKEKGYKKIDPFADTETWGANAHVLHGEYATKKSIRLRILKPFGRALLELAGGATKKSIRLRILKRDLVGEFETGRRATKKSIRLRILKRATSAAAAAGDAATKKSIRLRILKHLFKTHKNDFLWLQKNRSVCGY